MEKSMKIMTIWKSLKKRRKINMHLNNKSISLLPGNNYFLALLLVFFALSGFCQKDSQSILEYKSPNLDSLQKLSKKNMFSFIALNETNFETKLKSISTYFDSLEFENESLKKSKSVLINKNQNLVSSATLDSIQIKTLSDSLMICQILKKQNSLLVQTVKKDSVLIINLLDSIKHFQNSEKESQLQDILIDSLYSKIDSSLIDYAKVIFPAEGDGDCEVTVFKKDNQIKKIEALYFATMESLSKYYYYDNNQLICIKLTKISYDMPVYMEDHAVESIEEEVYYFSDNVLFLARDNNEKNLDNSYLSLKQIQLMTDLSVVLAKLNSN